MSDYPCSPCLLLEYQTGTEKTYLQDSVKQYREKLFVCLFIKLVSKNTHRAI